MAPLESSEYVAALILDTVRYQARGEADNAIDAWWILVAVLGEQEAKRRLAACKRAPDGSK